MQGRLVAAHPFGHIASHVVMLHGALPENALPFASVTILPPAWSISLEWQFYLVAPLLVWLALRSPGAVALIVVACVAARSVWYHLGIDYQTIGAFLPLHAEYFWLGGLSYFALAGAESMARQKNAVVLTVGCVLAFTPAVHAIAGRHLFSAGAWVPLSIWAIVLSSLVAPRPNAISRVLTSRPLQLLGRISYSTYLVHVLAMEICAYFAPPPSPPAWHCSAISCSPASL